MVFDWRSVLTKLTSIRKLQNFVSVENPIIHEVILFHMTAVFEYYKELIRSVWKLLLKCT